MPLTASVVWRIALFVATIVSSASACDVPVFRYALERWPADLFEVDVFYERELTGEQRAIVSKLEDQALINGGSVNWEVVHCRTDKPLDADLQAVREELKNAALPMVALRLPGGRRGSKVVWSGPLSDVNAKLWDTTGRTELVRRLLAGNSVVWLILPGKNEQPQRLQQLLSAQLPGLAEEIQLPPGVGSPGSELLVPIPLEVRFSALVIEDAVLRRIASSHLAEPAEDETLIVPVFGRGRAMATFRAGDVDSDAIAEVSRFLCGACSCQVKQQNPGYDLLLGVNWDERLFNGAATLEPETPNEPSAPEYVAIASGPVSPLPEAAGDGSTSETPELVSAKLHRSASGWIGWLTLGVVCGLLLIARRGRREDLVR